MKFNKTNKYEIYIGLKDQDTYEEIFDEKTFASLLSDICKKKQICFSLVNQLGGYTHNKGYVTETSLRITLIGIDESEVNILSNKLKEIINTDTVLITHEKCETMYV